MNDGLSSRGETEEDEEEEEEEEAESDAEQAESEWHTWLAGMVLVGGITLIVIPDRLLPELLVGLGPIFLVIGFVGWLIQWAYKQRFRS